MGRRKIEILPIQHDRNRSVTFLKRKNGLFKKAYELGVLCSVDVAVIIFGHNNKVYEYCSTDPDVIVQRRLKYTGERDVKTPADFGGDKANNDDDDDGSDEPVAGGSRQPVSHPKQPANGKKRAREDEHAHMDYTQANVPIPAPPTPQRTALPSISSLARGPPPPVSLPLPPYASIQAHQADSLLEREREREREREHTLRQLGLQSLLHNPSNQFPPPANHPSLVPNLNLASLFQAHPLLGLGVPGLNLGLGGLLGLNGAAPNNNNSGPSQQELLAMLSANANNVSASNALYSNPLFSSLFPNHPGLGGGGGGEQSYAGDTKPNVGGGGGDVWPTLGRSDPVPGSSTSTGAVASGSGADTSWLSFLGNSTGSRPSEDIDLTSLFPFDTSVPQTEEGREDELDDRAGKRAKR